MHSGCAQCPPCCATPRLQLYHSFVDGNATDGTKAGTDGCPTPVDNDVAADPQTCVSTKTQVC